jgi:hypothetical protein
MLYPDHCVRKIEGHMKDVKRILAYLKTFQKWRYIVVTTYPDHSIYPVEEHLHRRYYYPDAEEENPNNLPLSNETNFRMTVYVDADLAYDLEAKRSFTGYI